MDQSQEIFAEFIIESRENMELAEKFLLELETNATSEALNALFRAVHSVKGAAGFLELSSIAQTAHTAEALLGLLRDGKKEVSREVIDYLLAAVDRLMSMIDDPQLGQGSDVSDLKEIGERLLGGSVQGAEKSQQGSCSLPPSVMPLCIKATETGKYVYLARLNRDTVKAAGKDEVAFLGELLALIRELGEIIHPNSDISTSKGLSEEICVFFSSVAEPDIMLASMELPKNALEHLSPTKLRESANALANPPSPKPAPKPIAKPALKPGALPPPPSSAHRPKLSV